MRVMIATPTAGGTVMAAYAQTLAGATIALNEKGVDYRLLTVDGADVVISRNLLTHSFLSDAEATHILFIDSDMSIDIAVFRHFLTLDVPIVGAAYTERRMDLGAFPGVSRRPKAKKSCVGNRLSILSSARKPITACRTWPRAPPRPAKP